MQGNEQPPNIAVPGGQVWVTTYGPIRHETAASLMEMRSHSERNGLLNVRWGTMPGTLVDKARNECVRALLSEPNADWLLFIDGDMTFPPDALLRLLQSAYGEMRHADAIGAYCSLRGDLALPTLDLGSGTWESIFPGAGLLEVIRTGAAFILVKKHVYQALSDPWYCLRVPARPIDFMQEVDGFARQKFDGINPFANLPNAEWERLMQCAIEDPSSAGAFTPAEVGEDSNWADRVRAAGFRIFVDTNIVCGHVDTKVVDWVQHKKAMQDIERNQKYLAGLL